MNLVVTPKMGSVDLSVDVLTTKVRKRTIVHTEKECEEIQGKKNHLQATENFHRLLDEQTC